jgi:biopolymer transport protein ExbD
MIGSPSIQFDEETGERASYLTSMVDVLFMLLVFLVLTANVAHYQISVDLPEASPSEALEPEALLIEDRGPAEGWTFDDEVFRSLRRLTDRLRERLASEDSPLVTVAVDAAGETQRLIDLLEALNEAGAENVQIATRAGPG